MGDNTEIYAQVIVRGHDDYNAKTPTSFDIQRAQSRIGQTLGGTGTGSAGYWVVLYDVNRDGVITQEDIDMMQQSFDTKKPISGSRLLTVSAGVYQVTEINVPERYVDNISLQVLISGEETRIVRVHNVLNKGGIIIQKTAEDGVIANVQFRIINQTTGEEFVVSTDENGRAVQRITAAGHYTVEELNVPDRYKPVDGHGVFFFKVPNAYETITVHNVLKSGNLRIIKQSEDHVVSNVSFRIQSIETTSGETIDQVVDTDATGRISLELPQGTYVVTELHVPECYVPVDPQTIVLKAGEEATITFKNVLKVPTLQIIKTAEDGVVEGVVFQVNGTTLWGEAYNNSFTTDSNGEIFVNLPQGTYTIQEVQEERYCTIEPKTVTLYNDDVITVSFHNVLKTGALRIEKESEAGTNVGIPFQIQGMGMDAIVTTGDEGVFEISLKPGSYTIRELFEDEKYIIPEAQQVTIIYDQATTIKFQNQLKKFQLQLTKKDGSAQGGSMKNAIYGLYREDGTFIAQYTTDETGCFTTEAIPCERVYVQEIEAPKGYLLDTNQYWLNTSCETCFLEVTPISLEVTDYPITGNIRITKKMGTEKNWEYEPGAVFQVYLKEAGSYEMAKDWERDLLITDRALSSEDNNMGEATNGGEAGTKDLPLGTYIVHQVSGTEGYHLAEDIEVVLDENNRMVALDILNVAGMEFPNTGGIGSYMLWITGMLCLLIACSITLIIRLQKMNL